MKRFLFGLSLLPCLFSSCKEDCYNAGLVHNGFCTTDCPGVCGCDGRIYCNTCEAHRHGIEVNYHSPATKEIDTIK